jgi:hypothetical protein
MMRWLLPFGIILTLAGYVGPWVAHPVAGLTITGLDLGEYVKFLPVVREGSLWVWRPGFYAPLVAAGAAALLTAYRRDFAYPLFMRYGLLTLAMVAAFNLVPPAWTPTRLLEAEFRWQLISLLALLGGVALAPLLALLPHRAIAIVVSLLTLTATVAPLHGFYQTLPAIARLYNQPLAPAWGTWLMVAGQLMIAVAYWWRRPTETR